MLTVCKVFDSIPHFEILGNQVEITNLLKTQRLHKPTTIKSMPT